MKVANVVLLAVSLLWAAPLMANVNFGAVDIDVADRGQANRAAAIREGVQEAIIRLSGSRQIETSRTASILAGAERYVIGYGYRQVDQQLQLQLTVDWQRLRDAMVTERLPVWDFARPNVIVWLAIDSGLERQVLSADAPLIEHLNDVAQHRGIQLIWPLMDLQDQVAVSASDIWAVFDQPLRQASDRYDVSTMLVGRVSGRGTSWNARWDLIDATRSEYFATAGASIEQVSAEGLEAAVDALGRSFAYLPEATTQRHELVVVDILDAMEFAQLLTSLRSLSPIVDVQPQGLTDGRIALTVSSLMALPALNALLQRLDILEPAGFGRDRLPTYRRPREEQENLPQVGAVY